MIRTRGSGVLLHITSLPSPYGIGDLGPSAYRFVDFLVDAGQTYWQILPLNPTRVIYASSPYCSPSSFANNSLLVSPDLLVEDGLLDATDLKPVPSFPGARVDYVAVTTYKERLFDRAYERFRRVEGTCGYERFCAENAWWLEDHALFVALKARFGGLAWNEWPRRIRDRKPDALEEERDRLADRMEREKYLQYLFDRQWSALRRYCARSGVQIIGDIPIYVAYDSVDIWKNPDIVKLDTHLRPTVVAGVPPDRFSETGQLWGNPVYDWEALRARGYDWWLQRIARAVSLHDMVRIDHFRGFIDYWEVPAGEPTAERGTWVDGPGMDFLLRLARRSPCLPIIAEDLGANTPPVQQALDRLDLPGMRILLYAFGRALPESPHIPHNHIRHCILYTGTHDNNTVRGWFDREASREDKNRFFDYIGRRVPPGRVHWEFIRLAMSSVAGIAIIPMQDLLGLGEEARMNLPGTTEGNWEWRMLQEQFAGAPTDALRLMTVLSGRA